MADCDIATDELERIAARGWRGLDTGRLGDWLLRAADGWTGRANSVLPLGDPGRPIDEALTAVTAWYAERGLPARFQVPLPVGAALDEELERRGWVVQNPSLVMTASLDEALATLPDRPDLPPVTLDPSPTPRWMAAYHYRGGALPEVAPRVLALADDPVFALTVEDGRTLAIGRAVVDEGWCGITAVEVDPGARRRGLARHLMRGLLRWAGGRGARCVYLQVAGENAPAIGLYERMAFRVHHPYRYRLLA